MKVPTTRAEIKEEERTNHNIRNWAPPLHIELTPETIVNGDYLAYVEIKPNGFVLEDEVEGDYDDLICYITFEEFFSYEFAMIDGEFTYVNR